MLASSQVPRAGAPIGVVVADGQALVRAAFHALLDAQDDIVVRGEAADAAEALTVTGRVRPDVLLADIALPGLDVPELLRRLGGDSETTGVRVVVLATSGLEARALGALRAGASGILLTDAGPDVLACAVRAVAAGSGVLSPSVTRQLLAELAACPARVSGERPLAELTPREREVVTLVAGGMSNQDIAEQLVVSRATAKTHVSRALYKLAARDRAQLVTLAYETGLVVPRARAVIDPRCART